MFGMWTKNACKMKTKFPKTVEDLPDEFYGILTPVNVYIPGDERSRTNPGHGYPAHTEHYWNIQIFSAEENWRNEIVRLEQNDEIYRFTARKPLLA